MQRRTFVSTVAGAGLALAQAQRFDPTWPSLQRHTVPAWFDDAKLGIFIHWGLYSVPAWAEPVGELGKVAPGRWFYQNPYAEWYLNSIRLKESGAYKHHIETYGAAHDYYQFGKTFEEKNRAWQPGAWASLFQQVGARYVVLTTKHHDGYTLWPSKVPNPMRPQGGMNSPRDLVGELTKAVRAAGMKMGLYYSGGLDWTFEQRPVATMGDLKTTAPKSPEYARYADAHWRELMARYQPSVLWNDIGYPALAKPEQLFADYYNSTPEGLVNNRFSVEFSDFTTPEYAKYDKITTKKWESCRGLGYSFGYNQREGPSQVLPSEELIALLVDIVSKNGNLLLNIGPRPDGSISDIQTDRLKSLGAWLKQNGEAIFGTRPWLRATAQTPQGTDIRFTQKAGSLYATLLKRPAPGPITLPGLRGREGMQATVLGAGVSPWKQSGPDLVLDWNGKTPGEHALSLKFTPAPV